MSSKISKEFHSAYADGEMPERFVSEYENLVSHSEKSSMELHRVQKIHEFLKEDAKSISLSDEELDASFEKLKSRMNFSKNIRLSQKSKRQQALQFALPSIATAAAAIFVFALAPSHKTVESTAEIAAIPHTEIQPISSEGVKVDGTIQSGQFAASSSSDSTEKIAKSVNMAQMEISLIPSTEVKVDGNVKSERFGEAFFENKEMDENPTYVQKTIRASSLVSSRSRFSSSLTSVDVFRPDFSGERQLKIPVPEIHDFSE